MHELSVCQGLLAQVKQVAAQHHASSVDKIFLKLGPLSGVEPELLRAAFPIASSQTVAARAELIIDLLPIRVRCLNCQSESEVSMNNLCCVQCGDWRTQLISGDELLLQSIELEPAEMEIAHV